MINLTLNMPNYRLNLALSVTKRRKKAFVSQIRKYIEMLRNIRVGSPVSRAVRHVLERVNFKAILGGNLAVIVLTSGTFVPTVGSSGNIEPEITIIEAGEATLPTEVNVRYPVVEVKFNQGFHYFHKGIDLDGETGDKVYPIAKGIVTSLGFERFTLGNTITVKHDNGLESVYAHLSRIDVREGDEVDPNKPLGKLGSTGRSTGPHLHLEVYKDGRVVNPRSVLGYR